MPSLRFRAVAFASLIAVTGCSGLMAALTGHTNSAAVAGSQDLGATSLAQLLTLAPVPPDKRVALAISNLWVNYQLLAQAAAKGDSLSDPKVVDDAMWAQFAQLRSRKFSELLQKSAPPVDTATFQKHYTDGDAILAARHILIAADPKAMNPGQMDSVRKFAEGVLKQTTPANFAAMVTKYSADPGSKSVGGEYVFPRGQMVAEFEKAALALKPGEMSGLVPTAYGFHIILRETWPEAKVKWSEMYAKQATQGAEENFMKQLEEGAKIEVKPGAAKIVKALAEDLDGHRSDNTVLVSSRSMSLTAAKVARFVAAMPPQQRLREQITQAPDSVLPMFLKSVMRSELMLHAADSAKVTLDTADVNQIRRAFAGSLMATMTNLRVSPQMLADSAKTSAEREKLAVARVNTYMSALLKNEAQFVDVSEPVAMALRNKYDYRVVPAGIDKAVAEAVKLKATADSAKAKSMPSSVVPIPQPGAAPAAAPPAAPTAPPPAAPPATKKP